MILHDIIDREKIKFKTYPITGIFSILLLLLVLYNTIQEL